MLEQSVKKEVQGGVTAPGRGTTGLTPCYLSMDFVVAIIELTVKMNIQISTFEWTTDIGCFDA